MMIGYLTGRDDLEMFPQYQRAMEWGNRLYGRFRDEYGTVSCSEIQKLQFGRAYDLQNPEEREALHRKMSEIENGCQSVTRTGARLTAEIIVDMLEDGPPLARQLMPWCVQP